VCSLCLCLSLCAWNGVDCCHCRGFLFHSCTDWSPFVSLLCVFRSGIDMTRIVSLVFLFRFGVFLVWISFVCLRCNWWLSRKEIKTRNNSSLEGDCWKRAGVVTAAALLVYTSIIGSGEAASSTPAFVNVSSSVWQSSSSATNDNSSGQGKRCQCTGSVALQVCLATTVSLHWYKSNWHYILDAN